MKEDFKIDGKNIVEFIKSRTIVLENKNNNLIFDFPLFWFLIAMLFLSGVIIIAVIICLALGCKVSLVDMNDDGLS
ncbi:hypothetical protein ACLKMH_03070 [Psychromonas sp. KJ10-10]|uniref:hypothetical protein n=1 Tax=Psychromonas sp. KJ10-10 TaxID=3391823 RepID=UPI0039B69538